MKREYFIYAGDWTPYNMLIGPAKLIDGLVATLSFGTFFTTFSSATTFLAAKHYKRKHL